MNAALAYVATTHSPLVTCPLEDLLALSDQPNLPGSIDEHPNWRRRLPLPVETLFADPAVASRVEAVVRAREAVARTQAEPSASAGASDANSTASSAPGAPEKKPTP